MRFPSEFIDRLRNYLPISEVVGKRVPIKRHGREFHALCPFHKEKSPSFTVNDEKNFFHCFGCGAHGDSIGFIKDFEGVTYPEAVERLAIEAGLPVPQMTREAEEFERKRHTLEDVMALAAHWFGEQLETPGGAEARDYLRDRGLTAETIAHFGLGYAPGGREVLKHALMKQDISEDMLKEGGLIAVTDQGGTYDRFRGRLIFPIRSLQGKVVAFGGRLLPSAQASNAAKYLNSPETPLFKKGEILFAYDIAKRNIRESGTIMVAEGYMDVIALHQAGFTTAVAPLGTAVTESQLKLLWRAAPEPVMCLDGDAAGQRAMQRAAELALPLLKPGFSLKFATLPPGEDPDSLIKRSGSAAMQQVLAQANILSHVLWNQSLSHFGSVTAEDRASLEQHMMQTAEKIADPIVKQHMRSFFREQIFALNRQKKGARRVTVEAAPGPLPAANDDGSHLKRLEEQLISLIMLCPNLIYQADIEEYLGNMDFTQPILDKLRATALEVSADTESMDSASLCAAFGYRGYGEKVEALLHSKTATLPQASRAKILDNPVAALSAWRQTQSAYTMKKHELEMQEAERVLERDSSQANLDRFLALQKQVTELRRTRYAVTLDEQNF